MLSNHSQPLTSSLKRKAYGLQLVKVYSFPFRSFSLKLTAYRLRLKNSGFSLIELLIVLTIMGLLGSIVMPNSFQMLEQHQAQVEQKQFIDFFKEQKYQAYLLEQPIKIEFAGTELKSSLHNSIVFEHIYSDQQEIEITEHGSFIQDSVSYYFRDNLKTQVLGDL